MTGSQREAIELMKMMESVTVNSDLIAQALGMNPGVLRKHVRDGDYLISKVEICGSRIRFFREDFLRQIGEMPPEEEGPTDNQLLQRIVQLLTDQNWMLIELLKKEPPAAATTDG